jgi:hypothetical protein
MVKGDKVKFTDKTGENLEGTITSLSFDGNKNIISVLCFKKSWNTNVNCLVPKKIVTLIK